jgi:hypothetical protein
MRRKAFLSLVLSRSGMEDSVESPAIINRLLAEHLTEVTRQIAS